ncbi:MAG TPA: hypothetical protein VHZ50_14605 [Puia sp.]|nr:hypothetical protein [Puia sp.]
MVKYSETLNSAGIHAGVEKIFCLNHGLKDCTDYTDYLVEPP